MALRPRSALVIRTGGPPVKEGASPDAARLLPNGCGIVGPANHRRVVCVSNLIQDIAAIKLLSVQRDRWAGSLTLPKLVPFPWV